MYCRSLASSVAIGVSTVTMANTEPSSSITGSMAEVL